MFRPYGPLARFDHHAPPASPDGAGIDPDGRSVLYVAGDLVAAACEVFGDVGEARLCPRWRVGVVEPIRPLTLLDLAPQGAAMRIGALPALAQGREPRTLTQQWARAIADDEPAGPGVSGIHYRSAYDGGEALALWDCPDAVRTVAAGSVQDFPLAYPPLLHRLRVGLRVRHIAVSLIGPNSCAQCQRAEAL